MKKLRNLERSAKPIWQAKNSKTYKTQKTKKTKKQRFAGNSKEKG